MKRMLLIGIYLTSFYNAEAQKSSVSISAGVSLNGTGDTKGPMFTTEYSRYIKKTKFLWSASFSGTIHDGKFPILYEYPAGVQNDGSVNYTIAGLQTAVFIGRNFLKSKSKELTLMIGTVIRYQSSSYWDVLNVLYPPLTGLPYPVVVFENSTPAKTFAIGASSQVGYSFVVANNFTLGVTGGLQFDTQGDTISYLTIKFGKRF